MTPEQQGFFSTVAEAAFVNPFGERRNALDEKIGGNRGVDAVDAALARVRNELAALGDVDVSTFGDRQMTMELVVLFDVFHRFAPQIDRLIERQAGHARAVSVAFVGEIVAMLVTRGFAEERARRFVGVIYQLRRAFYFVSRTLAGTSDCMRHLRSRVWQNIFTDDIILYERTLWSRMEDFSTFFVGETGTGKGTAAAAMGRAGWIPWSASRGAFEHGFDDGFVAVNLSQFPKGLLESELFGHRKGAFTGAVEAHAGVFSRCRPHGTIFLDEIGEVDEPAQIKLLRVLQEREFTPVGSHDAQRFRGRVVAATNRDPSELLAEGRMRADFFYRLCSDVVEVPSLRQRIAEDSEELPVLVGSIVGRLLGAPEPAIVAEILDAVKRDVPAGYPWPGNVRELEQCVRRVLVTGRYIPGRSAKAPRAPVEHLTASELLSRHCAALYAEIGSYEGVARVVELDRRTVKKYVELAEA